MKFSTNILMNLRGMTLAVGKGAGEGDTARFPPRAFKLLSAFRESLGDKRVSSLAL